VTDRQVFVVDGSPMASCREWKQLPGREPAAVFGGPGAGGRRDGL